MIEQTFFAFECVEPEQKPQAEKYLKIYFDIDCPAYYHPERGYNYSLGFDTEADNEAFSREIREKFTAHGWTVNGEYGEPSKGKSTLFIHPQQVGGIIAENLKSEVLEILQSGKTFSMRKDRNGNPFVNVSEEKFDITVEDQQIHLAGQVMEIETAIIEAFRTRRRNLWWDGEGGKLDRITAKFAITAVDNSVMGAAYRAIKGMFNELIHRGDILQSQSSNGSPLYRTRTNAEKKQYARA